MNSFCVLCMFNVCLWKMYVVVRTSVCVNVLNSKEIVCLIIMKYITIYLKSKLSSNREILIKNRLYLRHRVNCVMEKLLLREVTASFV